MQSFSSNIMGLYYNALPNPRPHRISEGNHNHGPCLRRPDAVRN